AYEGGFYKLTVNFSNFDPGQTLNFSVDVDPVSIKGGSSPGPNESGSVSGLELAGTTATVSFSNGETHEVELYRIQPNSIGGSVNIARNLIPAAPSISVLGVPSLPATVFDDEQTVRVSAPAGSEVSLLQFEAGLFVEDLN